MFWRLRQTTWHKAGRWTSLFKVLSSTECSLFVSPQCIGWCSCWFYSGIHVNIMTYFGENLKKWVLMDSHSIRKHRASLLIIIVPLQKQGFCTMTISFRLFVCLSRETPNTYLSGTGVTGPALLGAIALVGQSCQCQTTAGGGGLSRRPFRLH